MKEVTMRKTTVVFTKEAIAEIIMHNSGKYDGITLGLVGKPDGSIGVYRNGLPKEGVKGSVLYMTHNRFQDVFLARTTAETIATPGGMVTLLNDGFSAAEAQAFTIDHFKIADVSVDFFTEL